MTPQGRKLFKIVLIVVGVFFIGVLAFDFLYPTGVPQTTKSSSYAQQLPVDLSKIKKNADTNKTKEKIYSAKNNLAELMHSHAYNYFRSNRIRKAIKTWEIASYLNPDNRVVYYRIKEAREILRRLVDESIALGWMDYESMRFKRSIRNWNRAARLVKSIDQKKYNDIQVLIQMAEGEIE